MKLSSIRKRFYFLIINNILAGPKYFKLKRNLMLRCGYNIGENTKIVGPLYVDSKLEIGKDCWIGACFKCYGNGMVVIGDNCDLAPNVTFATGGHKIGDFKRRAGVGESYKIIVKNSVWIGINSTLCRDIVVYDSSVIGACSFVSKDVLPNTLVGGVPAKIIRNLK